jgi:hypothetical protein
MKGVGRGGGERLGYGRTGKKKLGGKDTAGFLQHPQFDLSRNKPGLYRIYAFAFAKTFVIRQPQFLAKLCHLTSPDRVFCVISATPA